MDMQQKRLASYGAVVVRNGVKFQEVVEFTPAGAHLGLQTLWIDDVAVGQSWVDVDRSNGDNPVVYTPINGMTFQEWLVTEHATPVTSNDVPF